VRGGIVFVLHYLCVAPPQCRQIHFPGLLTLAVAGAEASKLRQVLFIMMCLVCRKEEKGNAKF